MALDTAFYLVTRDIAARSGLIASRYRIADGRFILDNKDLSRVRFTTEEYITGLRGVERIEEETARTLIAQNKFAMGEAPQTPSYQQQEEVQEPSPETEEEEENNGNNEQETEE